MQKESKFIKIAIQRLALTIRSILHRYQGPQWPLTWITSYFYKELPQFDVLGENLAISSLISMFLAICGGFSMLEALSLLSNLSFILGASFFELRGAAFIGHRVEFGSFISAFIFNRAALVSPAKLEHFN